MLCSYLIVLCAVCAGSYGNVVPSFMYNINLDIEPAFVKMLKDEKESTPYKPVYDLGFSSFTGNIRKKDNVLSLNGIDDFLLSQPEDFEVDTLTQELEWPNEVDQVPEGVFDNRVWTVAGGFCLTGKDNGSIALMDVSDKKNPEIQIITPFEEQIWFYHRVEWHDMDGDGDLDAVTARAYGDCATAGNSQLLWLENPGNKEISSNWEVHILHEHLADVAFRIQEMPTPDGGKTDVILTSGFWSFSLGLTWSSTNDWTDLDSLQYISVDNYGWYFDLEVVDINMDGRLDILTTTWSQLGAPGALLAYEIPDNWQSASAWSEPHILKDNYKMWKIPGKGAPGAAFHFWPTEGVKEAGKKPFILVDGDDDGSFYVMSANSENTDDWGYIQTTIYTQSTGTVGVMAIGDVDGDGSTEIILPIYSQNLLRVLTYA